MAMTLGLGQLGCGSGAERQDLSERPTWPTLGSRERPWLFDEFPGLHNTLPWLSLGQLPTPVRRLHRLEQALNFSGQIWLKRDGLSGAAYGGNKIRKLEFELAEAARLNAGALVSIGGLGSHQCCAVATFAQLLGLPHVAGMIAQPLTAHVRNNLLYNAGLGTEFVYGAHLPEMSAALYFVLRRLEAEGRNPYFIYLGTSTPWGTLGYADMMLELRGQIEAGELPAPDCIFTPLGSAGTLAGLLLGKTYAGFAHTDIVGVRVAESIYANNRIVRYLVENAAGMVHQHDSNAPKVELSDVGIMIDASYFGGEYGGPTAAGEAAHALLLDNEQLQGEATYTDKMWAAVIDNVLRPESAKKNILVVETYNAQPLTNLPGRESLPDELQWVFEAPDATSL